MSLCPCVIGADVGIVVLVQGQKRSSSPHNQLLSAWKTKAGQISKFDRKIRDLSPILVIRGINVGILYMPSYSSNFSVQNQFSSGRRVKYGSGVFWVRVKYGLGVYQFHEFWINLTALEHLFLGYFFFYQNKKKNSIYLLLKIIRIQRKSIRIVIC